VRTQHANTARTAWLIVGGLLAVMLLFAGCGSSDDNSTAGNEPQKLGKGEGEVNLISWGGYVEPAWSKPFEKKTGR
jgi:putative spermidine/putrescine transport system substrate-binding protein